jgi:hypothetical protein
MADMALPQLRVLREAATDIQCARNAADNPRIRSRLYPQIEAVEALQSELACGIKVARRLKKDLPRMPGAKPEELNAINSALGDWLREANCVRVRLHKIRKWCSTSPAIRMRAAAPKEVHRERDKLRKRRERAAPELLEEAHVDLAYHDEKTQTRRMKVRKHAQQYIANAMTGAVNPEATRRSMEAWVQKVAAQGP